MDASDTDSLMEAFNALEDYAKGIITELCQNLAKEADDVREGGPRTLLSIIENLVKMTSHELEALIEVYHTSQETMAVSRQEQESDEIVKEVDAEPLQEDGHSQSKADIEELSEEASRWQWEYNSSFDWYSYGWPSTQAEHQYHDRESQWDSYGSWSPPLGSDDQAWNAGKDDGKPGVVGKKLYVSNLPADVTQEEITCTFKEYGYLQDVHVMASRSASTGLSSAFIVFASEAEAKVCLDNMKDGSFMLRPNVQAFVKYAEAKGKTKAKGKGKVTTEQNGANSGGKSKSYQ